MLDADQRIANLVVQVGVLEQQLATAKKRLSDCAAARDAALEHAARLSRIYGATRGLRTASIRRLETGDAPVALAHLHQAEDFDAAWDASTQARHASTAAR